jgi:hypothetical protein
MTQSRMRWCHSAATWRVILLGYAPFVFAAHLAWEIAQLPLYTIWAQATPGEIAFAVLHCTAGDLMIALNALFLALIATRAGELAEWRLPVVGAVAVAIGLVYTVASERVNVGLVRWTYADAMPVVPVLDVGLSPLVQWIAVPLAAFWLLGRLRRGARGGELEGYGA